MGGVKLVLDKLRVSCKNVISNNSIKSIYLTGFIDEEDDGVAQFYPDLRFLYFEFGDTMIEIYKFEPVNKPSTLRIMIVDSIKNKFDLEDVMLARSKINEVIFKNPLATNRVAKMYYFNFEENNNELLCDALHIKLCNGQDIFLDPGFLGINIGALDVKRVWEENLISVNVPKEICIEFNNK